MNESEKPRLVVYVGNTLQKGLLRRFSVFREGEYPPAISALRAKSPALRGLFLPVEKLSEARKRVRTKGDILNTFVSRVPKELEK